MEKMKELKNLPREWKKCKTRKERKKFLKKVWYDYKMVFLYLIFGFFTTLVNILSYAACDAILKLTAFSEASNVISTIIAWVLSVLFAYFTNRKWVFESPHHDSKSIFKEFCAFIAARGITGLFDVGFMFVTVDILHLNGIVMKILDNIVVVIGNYVASKLWIFSDRKKQVKKH